MRDRLATVGTGDGFYVWIIQVTHDGGSHFRSTTRIPVTSQTKVRAMLRKHFLQAVFRDVDAGCVHISIVNQNPQIGNVVSMITVNLQIVHRLFTRHADDLRDDGRHTIVRFQPLADLELACGRELTAVDQYIG